MTAESWKPVPNFESCYEVSDLGRVRSLPRHVANGAGSAARFIPSKIKAQSKTKQGYASVCLYSKGHFKRIYVHRLVALAFLPTSPYRPEVNHVNGTKDDNRACNLEWVSGSENCRHAVETKLYEAAKGEQSGTSKLTEIAVLEIRAKAAAGAMHKDLAALYGVGRKAITKIVNRQRWEHI